MARVLDVAAGLVVGFDLDMTLVDTRPGIAAVWDAISAETGVAVDSAACVARLGPPLADEVANWFPAERVAEIVARYRALYPGLAIVPSPLLPGARAAVEAVRRHGGRSVVVTAKYGPSARLHLEHLGLDVDLVGDLYATGKAVGLREHGAGVYVGDHVGDVLGARAAGAVSVAVATGPATRAELSAAGADVVLDDLRGFPAWLDEHVLATRLAALQRSLESYGSVLVAFSGGADSAFVLAAAARALGPQRVVAATAVSPSLPATELAAAAAFAAGVGVRHVAVDTDEMSREGYAANAGDRCYFCKAELLDVLAPVAVEHGVAAVATGTNADDAVAGFRPGIRAAAERGAATPLRDAGLTKAQVREASRRLGLSTWDKPAAACLSSRVAYGVRITPHRLARVDRAESALRAALTRAGIVVRDLRVRDLGDDARVELDAAGLAAVTRTPELLDVVEGFRSVAVDPKGFRSGSMNETLADPERYR